MRTAHIAALAGTLVIAGLGALITAGAFVAADPAPLAVPPSVGFGAYLAVIGAAVAVEILGAMRTRAVRDRDDYVLNGSKMWITNGGIADVAVVWARTDEGVRGFLVEKGMKGFEAPEVHHKMSLRASVTSALYFDNVRVPKENVLPGVASLRGPLSCLTQARYVLTWGVTGAAIACYH